MTGLVQTNSVATGRLSSSPLLVTPSAIGPKLASACILYTRVTLANSFCVACETYRHIGIILSGVCMSVRPSVCPSVPLCVRLSGSHTFLVVTHSYMYVSEAPHAYLGMLPLFYKIYCLLL